MQVKDCMCGEVYCVKPETTVSEIAKLMEKKHIGSVPVCNNENTIVGIITDRDIILRTIACDKDVNTTKASDIMTTRICTCSQNEKIWDAEKKMAENQIRRIPVVENNKVVGILTLGDLANYNEEKGNDHFCTTIEYICQCEGQAKNNC